MEGLKLLGIKKYYDNELILDAISLTIPTGQFFALLGPSGCGKTTLLRIIAGFENADEGSIELNGTDITHIPSNQRSINTVFQNYALFPHLNVFHNVAYSLFIRGVNKTEIQHRVEHMLKSVHLEKQMFKSIAELSGGQKQRVALARAIINEPAILLLDEPLAALDLKLRERMLIELIELQAKIKTTFIYVTHDQVEALTVADRMAIMNAGVIEQLDAPKTIYEFPVSTFVAKFVGTTNIVPGVLYQHGDQLFLKVEGLGLLSVTQYSDAWFVSGKNVYMSLRPEKILISKTVLEGFSNSVQGIIESIVYHGRSTQYNVRLSNTMLIYVFEQNEEQFARHSLDYEVPVYLYWQKQNVTILER